MEKPLLYRKRFIPNETVLLKDDEILVFNEDFIMSKWNVLKPRTDFCRGYSCYFLKKGMKVSKFIDKQNRCIYTYCDIIDTQYDETENAYIFSDLLIDVVVYEDGFVKVLDVGEVADALDEGLITPETAKKALRLLDELLGIIYAGELVELTKYFDAVK